MTPTLGDRPPPFNDELTARDGEAGGQQGDPALRSHELALDIVQLTTEHMSGKDVATVLA